MRPLKDIDPAQLPEDQRASYSDLKTKVATASAAAPAGARRWMRPSQTSKPRSTPRP